MQTPEFQEVPPRRGAVVFAVRRYGRGPSRLWWLTWLTMLLSALSSTGINHIAALIVAKLAGDIADGGEFTVGPALPYVLGFAGVLLLAEALWRVALHCLNRLDARAKAR